MGRDRLSSGPQGRGDPARGPHYLDRRRVRCANVGASLQKGLACRGCGQADSARGGHEFRSRAGPKVRRPSAADPCDTREGLGRAAGRHGCRRGAMNNRAERLASLEASVKAIAAGDYAQMVPFTQETDEVGSLARSVEILKQNAEAMAEHRWIS